MPLKIAMLGHKRIPSREGGVEVVVEELATRMAALGHDVTVYNRAGHNVAGSEFDERANRGGEYEYHGVHIKTVQALDIRGAAALTSSYFATKAAIADKPDVIHFHAEGPSAMIGMARRAGIRSVATIHGLDWQRAKWGRLASRYLKHGEQVAATKADEIIVLSRSAQHYFEQTYGRKTNYIPNGVSIKESVNADLITKRYGLTCGSYILFLGRIVPEKGVHYLIEAYKALDTDKRLVIAGGSSDSNEYYEHVQELAEDDHRIIFTGFVQGRLLEELYSNAYLYVLPSDLEGMPMSLLEAMSYGLCCVTSDITECAEVLAGNGRTFPRGSADSLRRVLSNLIDNADSISRLSQHARAHVQSSYSWDTAVENTIKLYGDPR